MTVTFVRPFLAVVAISSVLVSPACAGGSGGAPSGPRVAQAVGEDLVCRTDQDCMLVSDCCGCAAGGTQHAVRADRLPDLEQQAEAACADAQCTGSASEHRSCQAVGARCAGGRCIPRL